MGLDQHAFEPTSSRTQQLYGTPNVLKVEPYMGHSPKWFLKISNELPLQHYLNSEPTCLPDAILLQRTWIAAA